ncbi:thiamine diphosphokinase [Martelella alba]|uniref:Thiamine diphosphokinase n=1 Tax=Martelella alba TaxID=2590451 RepID=A0A506UGP1_9HYPH|nr:thiamine diphosphokinase [Martelella alba]TPW32514.1 thiamine diphosphokinase [Martelella alba]
MTQTDFTILLGGALKVDERLSAFVAGSRFIAADGGMVHAAALGVTPELWVGDFDSSDAALSARFHTVARKTFPPAKAETDGALAVREAIARGARRIIMAGALSGARSDHAMMNMLFAVSLAEDGIEIMLTSGEEEAYPLLAGTLEIDLPSGALFSVLGFSDLTGLSIENAGYPLQGFSVAFGSPRTVSNIAGRTGGPVRLSLDAGRAIVLARPHDFTGV